jgi:hypothetical protein
LPNLNASPFGAGVLRRLPTGLQNDRRVSASGKKSRPGSRNRHTLVPNST